MSVPAFDLPAEHSLQAQFWLTPLAIRGKPMTLGSVRINRPGDDHERAVFEARVTHWGPRGEGLTNPDAVDKLAFSGPRHDGRAGDLIGTALMLAAARRGRGDVYVDERPACADDDLVAVLQLAKRAPKTAGERGEAEAAAIARVAAAVGIATTVA